MVYTRVYERGFHSCGLNSTCFCKLIAGEKRVLIARLWPHVFHGYRARGHYMLVPRVAIPLVTIPCMVHDKLHKTCMFHATSKRGPRKHVTGLFKDLSCCHACKNEAIIEQYCNL